MRILVTGSKGVVGSKLVDILSKKHSVLGVDILHHPGETGFTQVMSSEPNTYIRCDIGEYRQLERVFEKPFDMVYNCAAEFGRWNGEDYFEQLWKTNAIGTKNLIRLQERDHFKLVHFSSSEVYGDFDGPMKESVMDHYEIKQLNDYAMSKWVNEMQVRNSAALYGTETVIVRLFNTYGPGESYHPYRSVNSKFCYHAINGLPVTVFTNHYRSSSYIDDCAQTLSNIADNFIPGRVYNIGSSQFHNIERMTEIIWDYTGADKSLITYKESEKLTTKIKSINNELSVTELGHKETVSLEQGIKNTIEWMLK